MRRPKEQQSCWPFVSGEERRTARPPPYRNGAFCLMRVPRLLAATAVAAVAASTFVTIPAASAASVP